MWRLSSIWRTPHLPPPDPRLSGETINYYYFGHYLMALCRQGIGDSARHGVQFAIALIFALTALVVFGLDHYHHGIRRGDAAPVHSPVSPASSSC
jgi:uncharacterized membrane protein